MIDLRFAAFSRTSFVRVRRSGRGTWRRDFVGLATGASGAGVSDTSSAAGASGAGVSTPLPHVGRRFPTVSAGV
jgi:hypothetical protein